MSERDRWDYKIYPRGKLSLIGCRKNGNAPYIRIETASNEYVGSIDGRALVHLRAALDKALAKDEQ